VPKLQQQAAMLLSNLLTNKEIRESVRYLGWVDPVLNIVKNGDVASVQQILRVIINITFDAHCRYLLASADAEKHVANAGKRLGDAQVSQLSTTALKNLTVPAPPDVQQDVDNAKSGGRIKGVAAPKAQKRDAKSNDLEGLDDLIGDISGNKGAGSRPATASKPPPSRGGGSDGLDDLLGELNTPSAKPAPARASPAAAPASKPASQPARAPISKPPPKNNMGDLDDLLAEVSTPAPKPQPASASNLNDIDDLLADIDAPKKPTVTTKAAPAKATAAPAKAAPKSGGNKAAANDIDDLLADIGPSNPPPRAAPASKPPPKKQDLDDIDDLLDGINISNNNKGGGGGRQAAGGDDIDDLLSNIDAPSKQGAYNSGGGGDDIDDLLNGLGGGSATTDPGMSAIDDLLADLNG